MALHIICGRAGSGKSSLCIDRIAEHLSVSEKPVYLVVPEQYTLQAESKLLKNELCRGLIGNEVFSFKRMAFRTLSTTGGLARTKLNPSGRIMLLNHVIKINADRLKYFRLLATRPGEINRLLSLIDELGRYKVSPGMLSLISEKTTEVNFKNKLDDLSLLYGQYRELLTKEHIEEQDVYQAFLDRLKMYKPFKGATLYIDEFSGFTSYEFDIIEELIQQCENVNICLCMGESDEFIFRRVRNTYDSIVSVAKRVKVKVHTENISCMYRFNENRYLAHLEKYFGFYPAKQLKGEPEGIQILECKNIYSEVEASAREIVKLLRENKFRYRDIAVSARNIDSYEKIIRVVYPQYNIPFFIDSKKNIEDHPFIRFILNLLDIVGDNWEYRSVFDFLKTGLYTQDKYTVDYMENYVLEKGISGKKEWRLPFEKEDDINILREKLYNDISQFEENIKNCTTLKMCCIEVCSFLNKLEMQSIMQNKAEEFRKNNEAILADEYSRIWNITMEVIEQIYAFLGEEKCTGALKVKVKQFKEILLSGFSEYKVGFIPYTGDSIQVGEAGRTRNQDIKALILLGANEGVFPASFQDNGILSDSERNYLQDSGVMLAEDNKTRSILEYFLMYKVLTSPSLYLRISYPLENSAGEGMKSSIIIKRIIQLFPDTHKKSDFTMSTAEKLSLPGPFLRESAGELFKDDPLINCIKKWYNENEKWRETYKRYMEYEEPIHDNIYLLPEVIDELFNNNLYISASRIEKYNNCPFSYFLSYGIKAGKRKENVVEVSDIGTFIHSLIDKVSKTSGVSDRQDIDMLLIRAFNETLDEMGIKAFYDTERNKYITERLLRYTKSAFTEAVRQVEAGLFVPAGFETVFGDTGEIPAVTVDTGNGKTVKLQGRIDRYDTYTDGDKIYIRVIDYKSSGKSVTPGDIITGHKIQLITYIDALVNGLEKKTGKQVIPVAALYYTLSSDVQTEDKHPGKDDEFTKSYRMNGLILDDKDILEFMLCNNEDVEVIGAKKGKNGISLTSKNEKVPPGGFNLLRKQLHETVKNTVSCINEGNISALPVMDGQKKPCDYCEYMSICRVDISNPDNFKRIYSMEPEDAYKTMEDNL